MSVARRKPDGSGFGHSGGSNLTDYLGAAARSDQIELDMVPGERLVEIPIELIDPSPYQARARFDENEIEALGEDLKGNGLYHPVSLREGLGGRYELVAGERRWLAAKKMGLPHVTARVRPLDDFGAHLVGVSENNQRANLAPWEMAVEASRLRDHAKEAARPHTQRDLARYLNRNVAIVNQQLVIAAAITTDLLSQAKLTQESLCNLPHVTLLRISKLPLPRRARALKEAIRMQQSRCGGANGEATSGRPSTPTHPRGDRATDLWEQGGLHLQVRKPLRDLVPEQAEKYLRQVLPAIGGLAARVANGDAVEPVLRWDGPQGTLLFIMSTAQLDSAQRQRAQEALRNVLSVLEAPQSSEVENPSLGPVAAER